MKKVYCGRCRWCETEIIFSYTISHCTYLDNLKVTEKDTWYKLEKTTEYLGEPEDINKNNDCKWFGKKRADWGTGPK